MCPGEKVQEPGAAPAPWARPQAGPKPSSRHKEEAELSTHLQGSDASCHTTRHSCVGLDFLQDLFETALKEAITQVRMSKRW